MTDRIPPSSFCLYPFPVGTQVVTLRDVVGQNGRTLHPRGAVGVVVKSPTDLDHAYRIRFPDGVEESLNSGDLTTLAKFKEGEIGKMKEEGGRMKYADPGGASYFDTHPSSFRLQPCFVCII